MTTQWQFTLPYPSIPKGLSANYRGHWGPKAASTAMVRRDVMGLVRAAHIPGLSKIRVDVERVVNLHRTRDADNLSPLLKAIYDGIGSNTGVSARIVDDDNPECIEKPEATFRYARDEQPRIVVTITDIGGDI